MSQFVSLFSGIGGFECGLRESGFEAEVLCDVDPAAQAVLAAHFPSAKLVKDVHSIRSTPKDLELLTAGFPCQDLSSSGFKEGIYGARSGLVSEVFRIVKQSHPRWVLIENVHFMLHLKKGAAIRLIIEELEALGYSWAFRVLDSLGFGLPQRRRRVFILASRSGDPRNVLLSDTGSLSHKQLTTEIPIGFYWTEGTFATGLAADAIPPLKGGSTIGIPSPPAVLMPDGVVGTPQIADAEALQGFPRGWTSPAEEVAKASIRWRLLGNAVPVNVASWIGKRLRSPIPYDPSEDLPLEDSGTWPDAAWGMAGARYKSRAAHFVAHSTYPSLAATLKAELKPLSKRAASGFLARARKGNLRYPNGFLERIERFAEAA